MEQPQQPAPQQVAPQQIVTVPAPPSGKHKKWYITMIVLCVLIILANLGLCGYFAYRAVNRYSGSYYYGSSYYYYGNSTYYTWRASVCGGVAFFVWVALIYYIVRYRRMMKSLRNPMSQVVPVVQWQPAYVQQPYPGYNPQQPQFQGYVANPYPQPGYGPPPPGQQPHPDFAYQQPQPPQQQPHPVSPPHV
ncbi:hypothetical protein GGF44_001029 [Coemansia sp. RSA 1694]|nr:hypothetical protein GGF44_001029 [Coemansia sp. RSA 1694]